MDAGNDLLQNDTGDGRPLRVRWHYRDYLQRIGVPWYVCDAAVITAICEVLVHHFATMLPYAPIAQRRGHSRFARKNGQERKLTASQGSRTVVIVVVRMLVFVIFCKLNAAKCRLHLGCPGCVATPYLVRLYRSLRRARPIEGGIHGMALWSTAM